MRLRITILSVLTACGGGDSSPDGGSSIDAGLESPVDTWEWVELAGTECANGTPAGYGINRSAMSPDVFVYFQGGGACWDATTCFVTKTSIHIEDTYTAQTLEADGISGTVVRNNTTPPIYAATAVFVPYCTGDLHAGTQTLDYDVAGQPRSVAHVGGLNAERIAASLAALFPDAETVWLGGSSAGGFGATFNHHRFTGAYPNAEVHVLQDGAPFVPVVANYAVWQTSWQLEFPPDCVGCDANLPAVMDAVAAANPTSRFGLLHYDDDTVIKIYFGYPGDAGVLVPATNALLANQYDRANTKAFVLAGSSHTMLAQANDLIGAGGVRLADWILQWASGDPVWATVR